MSKNKTKFQGQEAFLNYYRDLFTNSKIFDDFLISLSQKHKPILLFNPQFEEQIRFLWEKSGLSWETVTWFTQALYWPEQIPFGETVPGYEEKLIYPMNISSLLPVLALNPQSGELILDACAAPGGKTLGMYFLTGQRSLTPTIIANDVSASRRLRLRQNLDDYQISNIEFWGRPAETIFKQQPNHFDKILLDAPCSSEKHVFNDTKYLKVWTPNRIKTLHQRQLALLGGLLLALKPGGTLIYSTCAINICENEGTVGEFLRKKGDLVELIDWKKPIEGSQQFLNQDFGFDQKKVLRVLPHENFDPMFVAVFRRK